MPRDTQNRPAPPVQARKTGRGFRPTVIRDLREGMRQPGRMLAAPVFFTLAVVLFPLGLSPEPSFLAAAAPGLLVIAMMFAALFPADRLFADDVRDRTLEGLLALDVPLALYAAGRLAAVWIMAGLPMVMMSPLLALILGLPGAVCWMVPLVLLPGSLLLLLFGALGAALTIGARQGTVLLALLVLPLYIPVLIFSAGAIDLFRIGGEAQVPLLLLWAMLAAALPLVPVVCGAILKDQLRQ